MNDREHVRHIIETASSISTATLHEAAGKRGNLPSAIKPLDPGLKVCGRALTVCSPSADNLWLHRAIAAARPGDVIVADVGNCTEAGHWGEMMAFAAQVRSVAGLVINGGVRDKEQMIAMKFPVFAAAVCIRGTEKDKSAFGAINRPVRIGDTTVAPGDLIAGDADGVVAIAWNQAESVVRAARTRDLDEIRIKELLSQGKTTLEIYGL